ncbi:hypothetical protein FALBO_3347 [Fusarium albosuccineum]|uniref:Pt repeat family protein n=1 Tax=Fusarium albosuccineum TaxID=1237068 RepID=A0A8H4LJ71_9HYPO|nr:hypothetical protein FALBO_3347 [Fusarium albosuccineum]
MPLRRPSTAGDGHSVSSSPSFSLSGTKRRFPLLGRKKTRNSELPRPSSVVLPQSPSSQKITKPGLRVHVQVKFESPVGLEHVRDYEASPQLKASDRICQALLSRLQHCSAEFITRHDCTALDPLRKPHRDVKPLRYRITYRVERDGLILVEKSLRSFQEYELTHDDAREVIAATDRIVGLFLVRHDPGFRWSDSADAETANPESETVRPCTGRPQSTACIPRSHFVHETQSYELVAGYSIELFLRSRCATRYPENRNASIKIDSRQPTPLPLLLGEELTTRVSNLVIDPVDSWKRKFDKRHKTCSGFEGSGGCTHIEDGAVDIMVKVRNNLGPDYTYFSHRIQTSKVLFNDHNGRDFDEFANQVKSKLEKARDMTDKSMRSLDDLTLHIRELRGKNWSVHEPLVVRLDPTITYCRQTIEAVMERLQTGISNVLEHHEDALATMTVHKRGHLIFDGFLDGAGGDDRTPLEKFASPEVEKKALETRLKERIRADITMLCKDTCAIDSTDTLPNLRLKVSGAAASSIGAASIAPPRSVGASSAAPTPSLTASGPLTGPSSQVSLPGSLASSRSEHTLSKKVAQQNLRDSEPPASPAAPSPDLRRVPSGVEMAKKHGYMSDFIADDENQSEPPSTPSLVDTDSLSPRDSVVVSTPQSARVISHDQSNEGLRIVDDGRRIIYQEQSDMDAIAAGVVDFHRPINDDDEPIQLTKEPPAESPDRRAARRSLDTRMPDLSGTFGPPLTDSKNDTPVPQKEQEPEKPLPSEPQEAKAAKDVLHTEGVLEYFCKPTSPPAEEAKPEEPTAKPEEASLEVPKIVEPQAEVETASEKEKVDLVAPSSVEKTETPQPSHDEQWEMVDANTKSETSFGTTPAASVHEDVDAQAKSEAPTPKANPAPVEHVVVTDVDAAKEPHKDSILDDFPKPPPSVHSEEVHHESPGEPAKEPTIAVEDSAAVREPSDSGISMEEQAKQSEPTREASTVLAAESDASKAVPTESAERPQELSHAADEPANPLDDEELGGAALEAVSEEAHAKPTTPIDDEELGGATLLESVPEKHRPVTPENRVIPGIASAPLEAFPANDFFSLPSVPEKEEEPAPPVFDSPTLTPVRARPRARSNALPERRYSTALTLEIGVPSFDRDSDASPTNSPPRSAGGTLNKDTLHRRQASAGFIGLQEQRRMHSVGLRSALMPYHWQGMRRGQAIWEGRPGTSHSEQ